MFLISYYMFCAVRRHQLAHPNTVRRRRSVTAPNGPKRPQAAIGPILQSPEQQVRAVSDDDWNTHLLPSLLNSWNDSEPQSLFGSVPSCGPEEQTETNNQLQMLRGSLLDRDALCLCELRFTDEEKIRLRSPPTHLTRGPNTDPQKDPSVRQVELVVSTQDVAHQPVVWTNTRQLTTNRGSR